MEEIMKTALPLSRLGPAQYSHWFDNNEYFAAWCRNVTPELIQVMYII
jgi:hypothetical protein